MGSRAWMMMIVGPCQVVPSSMAWASTLAPRDYSVDESEPSQLACPSEAGHFLPSQRRNIVAQLPQDGKNPRILPRALVLPRPCRGPGVPIRRGRTGSTAVGGNVALLNLVNAGCGVVR